MDEWIFVCGLYVLFHDSVINYIYIFYIIIQLYFDALFELDSPVPFASHPCLRCCLVFAAFF